MNNALVSYCSVKLNLFEYVRNINKEKRRFLPHAELSISPIKGGRFPSQMNVMAPEGGRGIEIGRSVSPPVGRT